MNFQVSKQYHRPIKALQNQSEAQRHSTYLHGFINRMTWDQSRPRTCQWIEGDPKKRMFCGEANQDGSSYCPEHHARCFTKNILTPEKK